MRILGLTTLLGVAFSSAALGAPTADAIVNAGRSADTRIRASAHRCAGFVSAVLRNAGFEVDEVEVNRLLGWAGAHGANRRWINPRPGDLVAFDRTYDKNGDGVRNDRNTHVGVVLDVESDGTVTFVHNYRSPRVIEVSRLNLQRRSDPTANSPLVRRNNGYAESTDLLAGELFSGFYSVTAFAPEESPTTADASVLLARLSPSPQAIPPVQETCAELWWRRNEIYATVGYEFETACAQDAFEGVSWYQSEPGVDQMAAWRTMTRSERREVRQIRAAEQRQSCPVNICAP